MIDTFSPPLHIIGGLLHHRRKTISSAGSTSFPHLPVQGEWVGGQQAVDSFPPAASRRTKKKKNHLFDPWKKGGVGSLTARAQRETRAKYASIVWQWEGSWEIWATAVRIFGSLKWLPVGARSSLPSEIISSIYLLTGGLVMIVLVWLFFS